MLLGGENVEPTPIEEALKESPYISQVMVVGQDKQAPRRARSCRASRRCASGSRRGAPPARRRTRSSARARTSLALVKAELHRLLTEERGFKYYERIPRFALLEREFAVGEEMTQTMKMQPQRDRGALRGADRGAVPVGAGRLPTPGQGSFPAGAVGARGSFTSGSSCGMSSPVAAPRSLKRRAAGRTRDSSDPTAWL